MPPRLRTVCRVIAWFAAVAAGFVALGILASLLHAAGLIAIPEKSWLHLRYDGPVPAPGATAPFRLAGALLEAVPDLFLIWIFLALWRLMRLYAAGAVFAAPAMDEIRRIAQGMIGRAVAILVLYPLAGLVMDWPLPGHALSLHFGSNDAVRLAEAGIVFVVAQVMTEACRIADENARFV